MLVRQSPVRLTRILLLTLLLGGCQEKESAAPAPPPAPAPQAVVPASDAGGPPRPGDTLTLSGLTLKLLESGEIQLSGLDRWGNKLDTTFENREYLTNAMPTLERSLTDEQAARLKSILQSMQ